MLGSRFLAEPGKLVLHQGVRKAGLMGFCDVAPGEMKHLRVAYLSADRPHVALLTDLQVGSESLLRLKLLAKLLHLFRPCSTCCQSESRLCVHASLRTVISGLFTPCRARHFLMMAVWKQTRSLPNRSVRQQRHSDLTARQRIGGSQSECCCRLNRTTRGQQMLA